MKTCEEEIRQYRPDVVILIDYPSFNLKIAEFVKKELNLPVYYYISPKIWAWVIDGIVRMHFCRACKQIPIQC